MSAFEWCCYSSSYSSCYCDRRSCVSFPGTWDQRRHTDWNLRLQIKLTNLSAQRSLFTRWTRGGGSLPNRFICSVTRPSPSHPCLCHRKGEEVDLWSKEGSLRGLLKSSAPPRRGLSGCCYRRFHHIRSCDAHQSQEPATRVLLNLGDVVKWFSWFLKGKREESAAVDQAKAKEDAKVQDERSGSVCFYGWANFKSSFSLVDPL